MQKKILIICDTNLSIDPRVIRQFQALENDYIIDSLAKAPFGSENHFYALRHKKNALFIKLLGLALLAFKLYSWYHKVNSRQTIVDKAISNDYDLFIVNDLEMVPLGTALAQKKVPIWADLHEYSPGQVENDFIWRMLYKPYKEWIGRRFLPNCSRLSTVCESIAEKYSQEFNVEVQEVIYNSPDFEMLVPSHTDNNLIQLVHHGIAIARRHLELMIDVLDHLPDHYELNLLLVANNKEMEDYKNNLMQYAKTKKAKVNFLEPVPTKEIAKTINKFDIGLFILRPVNFNYAHALPNKFFEFIQARLCIAVSPNVEMKNLVNKYSLGVVSDDFTAKEMAKSIMAIGDIQYYKTQSDLVAKELSSEDTLKKIRRTVHSVLAPQ